MPSDINPFMSRIPDSVLRRATTQTLDTYAHSNPGREREPDHCFNTGSPAEHVHRLDFFYKIPFFPQQARVPGEGGGIAGNIDQPVRPGIGNGFDDGGLQSFARRIHNDHVRPQAVRDHPGQQVFRFAGMEGRVPDAVAFGIVLRVLHSGVPGSG